MSRKWYNVTLERKLNTEYFNSTGEELELHAYSRRFENTYGFTAVIYDEKGGHKLNPVASVLINGHQYSDRRAGLYVTIPAGAYYQIRHNASLFLQTVNELRASPPSEADLTDTDDEEEDVEEGSNNPTDPTDPTDPEEGDSGDGDEGDGSEPDPEDPPEPIN